MPRTRGSTRLGSKNKDRYVPLSIQPVPRPATTRRLSRRLAEQALQQQVQNPADDPDVDDDPIVDSDVESDAGTVIDNTQVDADNDGMDVDEDPELAAIADAHKFGEDYDGFDDLDRLMYARTPEVDAEAKNERQLWNLPDTPTTREYSTKDQAFLSVNRHMRHLPNAKKTASAVLMMKDGELIAQQFQPVKTEDDYEPPQEPTPDFRPLVDIQQAEKTFTRKNKDGELKQATLRRLEASTPNGTRMRSNRHVDMRVINAEGVEEKRRVAMFSPVPDNPSKDWWGGFPEKDFEIWQPEYKAAQEARATYKGSEDWTTVDGYSVFQRDIVKREPDQNSVMTKGKHKGVQKGKYDRLPHPFNPDQTKAFTAKDAARVYPDKDKMTPEARERLNRMFPIYFGIAADLAEGKMTLSDAEAQCRKHKFSSLAPLYPNAPRQAAVPGRPARAPNLNDDASRDEASADVLKINGKRFKPGERAFQRFHSGEWGHVRGWGLFPFDPENPQAPQTIDNLAAIPMHINSGETTLEWCAKWFAINRPEAETKFRAMFKILANSDIAEKLEFEVSLEENDINVRLRKEFEPFQEYPVFCKATDLAHVVLAAYAQLTEQAPATTQPVRLLSRFQAPQAAPDDRNTNQASRRVVQRV